MAPLASEGLEMSPLQAPAFVLRVAGAVVWPGLPCPEVTWKTSAFSPLWTCDLPNSETQQPTDNTWGALSLCCNS